MRGFVAVMLALGAAAVPAAPAHAEPSRLSGTTCGMATTNDIVGVFANPGTQVGSLYAAVAVVDPPSSGDSINIDPAANPLTLTVTCEVVNAPAYGSPEFDTATATGSGVAVAENNIILLATPESAVFVCTTITVNELRGGPRTVYFDAQSGGLKNDSTQAECALATWQELPPPAVCDSAPPLCPLDRQTTAVVVPTPVVLLSD